MTQKKRQRKEEGNLNGIAQEMMTILPPLGVLLGNFRSLMKKGKLWNLPEQGKKGHRKNQESEQLWISQEQDQSERTVLGYTGEDIFQATCRLQKKNLKLSGLYINFSFPLKEENHN